MLISPPERGDGIGLNSDTLPTIEDWNRRPVLRSCAISQRAMVLGWGGGAYPGRCHCCVTTRCRCRHQHAPSSLSSPCAVVIAMLLWSWCAVLVIALPCTTLSCHCMSSVVAVACLPLSLWAVTRRSILRLCHCRRALLLWCRCALSSLSMVHSVGASWDQRLVSVRDAWAIGPVDGVVGATHHSSVDSCRLRPIGTHCKAVRKKSKEAVPDSKQRDQNS